MRKAFKKYVLNYILPAVSISAVSGFLTGAVITLYKFCASKAIMLSETAYHVLSEKVYLIPVAFVAVFVLAVIYSQCYKKYPNLQGGGIPTSIGILRGLISFNRFKNLLGTFALSISSFFVGVPLGNEGPSVQIGTAIGGASAKLFGRKGVAWNRYSMTGGACAGFSVATGAPISGILFSVEEAHQRVSPLIIIVSAVSVAVADITSKILSPMLGVNTALFPEMKHAVLSVKEMWLPVFLGVAFGLFAVAFLKYYRLINSFCNKKLKNIPQVYRIFAVFAITVVIGMFSHSFVSTGHELVLDLFEESPAVYTLLIILAVRSTLTLCANTNGITGGLFVPMLSIGAVFATLSAGLMHTAFGVDKEYYALILALGITASIAGMMKMPLTAVLFSVEALNCHNNIVPVIMVSATAYIITEIFKVNSINDVVLENKVENLNKGKTPQTVEEYVTVKKGSFAIGKHIRDILWPPSLLVLSLEHDKNISLGEDEKGEICEGDTLYVRYTTFDKNKAKEELSNIIGK